MSPEFSILLFTVAAMAFAYVAIYPILGLRRLTPLMIGDAVLTVAVMILIGLVYGGTGQRFSLLVIDVPWWAFGLVTLSAAELPFFIWYCKRYDIDFTNFSDD